MDTRFKFDLVYYNTSKSLTLTDVFIFILPLLFTNEIDLILSGFPIQGIYHKSDRIISFTSGATESIRWAEYPRLKSPQYV